MFLSRCVIGGGKEGRRCFSMFIMLLFCCIIECAPLSSRYTETVYFEGKNISEFDVHGVLKLHCDEFYYKPVLSGGSNGVTPHSTTINDTALLNIPLKQQPFCYKRKGDLSKNHLPQIFTTVQVNSLENGTGLLEFYYTIPQRNSDTAAWELYRISRFSDDKLFVERCVNVTFGNDHLSMEWNTVMEARVYLLKNGEEVPVFLGNRVDQYAFESSKEILYVINKATSSILKKENNSLPFRKIFGNKNPMKRSKRALSLNRWVSSSDDDWRDFIYTRTQNHDDFKGLDYSNETINNSSQLMTNIVPDRLRDDWSPTFTHSSFKNDDHDDKQYNSTTTMKSIGCVSSSFYNFSNDSPIRHQDPNLLMNQQKNNQVDLFAISLENNHSISSWNSPMMDLQFMGKEFLWTRSTNHQSASYASVYTEHVKLIFDDSSETESPCQSFTENFIGGDNYFFGDGDDDNDNDEESTFQKRSLDDDLVEQHQGECDHRGEKITLEAASDTTERRKFCEWLRENSHLFGDEEYFWNEETDFPSGCDISSWVIEEHLPESHCIFHVFLQKITPSFEMDNCIEARKGCDGIPNSLSTFDQCGECGGNCIPSLSPSRTHAPSPSDSKITTPSPSHSVDLFSASITSSIENTPSSSVDLLPNSITSSSSPQSVYSESQSRSESASPSPKSSVSSSNVHHHTGSNDEEEEEVVVTLSLSETARSGANDDVFLSVSPSGSVLYENVPYSTVECSVAISEYQSVTESVSWSLQSISSSDSLYPSVFLSSSGSFSSAPSVSVTPSVSKTLSLNVDFCGVVGGDNSTCSGCDGVPFSPFVFDLCGVCGGMNECISIEPSESPLPSPSVVKQVDVANFDGEDHRQSDLISIIVVSFVGMFVAIMQLALLFMCLFQRG